MVGSDEYKGRPHPMIDPSVRDDAFARRRRSSIAVIICRSSDRLRCHPTWLGILPGCRQAQRQLALIVSSVCGTSATQCAQRKYASYRRQAFLWHLRMLMPANLPLPSLAAIEATVMRTLEQLPRRLVIAIGGNAVHPEDIAGTGEEQKIVAMRTAQALLPLAKLENELIITHGNGPVVGKIMMRQMLTMSRIPMPMDICVAHSQGGSDTCSSGHQIPCAKWEMTDASVLTQVEVDAKDPAFGNQPSSWGRFPGGGSERSQLS